MKAATKGKWGPIEEAGGESGAAPGEAGTTQVLGLNLGPPDQGWWQVPFLGKPCGFLIRNVNRCFLARALLGHIRVLNAFLCTSSVCVCLCTCHGACYRTP